MQVSISNIGMIKEAKIDLQGLTVIAGENDSGKSTVGKLIFAIIRALNKYEEEFERDRMALGLDKFERINYFIRRSIEDKKYIDLRREFGIADFKVNVLLNDEDPVAVKNLLSRKQDIISQADLKEDVKAELIQMLEDSINVFSLQSTDPDILKIALSKALLSEFGGQINSLFNLEEGIVKCLEGSQDIFEVIIEDSKIKEIRYVDDIYFKDVTYIESPVLIQFHNYFDRSQLYDTKSLRKVPIHMMDLISKLQLASEKESEQPFSLEDLLEQRKKEIGKINSHIENIIQGGVDFKREEYDFVYTKHSKDARQKINIASGNIAMGIKSLGMIQMLINSGILNDRSILIIDEPEVHLHPKWQVEYAKIIIEIVKLGIPVLINTHSPYILQALRVFSEREKCEKLVRYYLAEVHEGENSSIFEDVTDNLHKAFKKLSDPIQNLVWY